MKITTIIAFVLAIIGAIVWGLVGIFDYNVVAAIFGAGAGAIISRVIYTLVGVAFVASRGDNAVVSVSGRFSQRSVFRYARRESVAFAVRRRTDAFIRFVRSVGAFCGVTRSRE